MCSSKSHKNEILPSASIGHWFGKHAWQEKPKNIHGNHIRECRICGKRQELVEHHSWAETGWQDCK